MRFFVLMVLASIVAVTMLLLPPGSVALSQSKESPISAHLETLKERCASLVIPNKVYHYFEGKLRNGYLFVVPYMPPNLPCDAQKEECVPDEISAYVMTLEDKNGALINVSIKDKASVLKKAGFKDGNVYGLCYSSTVANNKKLWIVDGVDSTTHLESEQ